MIPDLTICCLSVLNQHVSHRGPLEILNRMLLIFIQSLESKHQYLRHADCILQLYVTTDSSKVRIKKLDNTNRQTNKMQYEKCISQYTGSPTKLIHSMWWHGVVVELSTSTLPPLGWIQRTQPRVLNKVLQIIFMPYLVPAPTLSQLIINDWLVFVWFYGEWGFFLCEKVKFFFNCSWKRTDCWVS